MTLSRKIPILIIVIICFAGICCVPAVTAWNVSSVTIDPSGSLIPGTPVIVTASIEFPGEDVTFDPANEFRYSTDLTSAKWFCVPVSYWTNDRMKPGGPVLANYPASRCQNGKISFNRNTINEPLKLTMEGITSAVEHTTNITILKIDEYNSSCGCIKKTVQYFAVIVNASETMEKTKEIRQTEHALLLDKEWAEKTVTDAEIQITKANDKINAIHANLSRSFDERLTQSYVKRDMAASDIALAKENISKGDFPQARIYAYAAIDEANLSYYEALDAQKRMADDPLNAVPLSLPIVCLAVLGAGLMVQRVRES